MHLQLFPASQHSQQVMRMAMGLRCSRGQHDSSVAERRSDDMGILGAKLSAVTVPWHC